MPETTPLIKAALNLRVGVGFDVYVDWANISVLSQVIHNVNERKTVQTNMISFVSHGDKTLQRLIGMSGEQEHHISSVPFFFS